MKRLQSVLLVEDSEPDIELTLSALQENHIANPIAVVRDGAEALDYLHRRGSYAARPDENPMAIILDLKLPKVSGLQVLREIKSDQHLKTVPVIVLSSSREEPDLRECYALGTNAYVVKPVEFEQFITAVKNLGLFWAMINEPPP